MTDFASSARPPRCAIAWATAKEIFVEIPHRDGPPLICRYRKTVEGLTAALNVLIEYDAPMHKAAPAHPKTTKIPARSHVTWANDTQRAAAREILKKMKIT